MDKHTEWQRIEAEAREQVHAEMVVLADTPLVFGEHIAWVDCLYNRTDMLSPVHRVGFPQKNQPYTTCGEAIPAPARWFTLTARLVRSMEPCRFCEAEYARAPKEFAA